MGSTISRMGFLVRNDLAEGINVGHDDDVGDDDDDKDDEEDEDENSVVVPFAVVVAVPDFMEGRDNDMGLTSSAGPTGMTDVGDKTTTSSSPPCSSSW